MMVQQSKPYHNTVSPRTKYQCLLKFQQPLHLAAMKGNIDIVKMFAGLKTPALLLRDINGFTPLHIGVKQGYTEITTILGEAGPTEAFYMENAVGELPIETAIQKDLILRYREATVGHPLNPRTLQVANAYVLVGDPFPLSKMETRVPALKKMVEELLNEGRLSKGTKLHKALISFVDKMEAKIAEVHIKEVELKAAEEAAEETETQENEKLNGDSRNPIGTLQAIRKIVKQKPAMHRLLIHIADVHKSVQAVLPEPEQDRPKPVIMDEHDLEEAEEEGDNTEQSRYWLSDDVNLSDNSF